MEIWGAQALEGGGTHASGGAHVSKGRCMLLKRAHASEGRGTHSWEVHNSGKGRLHMFKKIKNSIKHDKFVVKI